MLAPDEKYATDPDYRNLVNFMEAMIKKARFSPSEMREAATLACIHFEMHQSRVLIPRFDSLED